MRRKFRFPAPKKCPVTRKTMFKKEEWANKAKMYIWSHDPQAKLEDLHVYPCDHCHTFHVGHISYYQKSLQGATA